MTDVLTSRSPLTAAELEAWDRDGYHVARGLVRRRRGGRDPGAVRRDRIRGQTIPDHWTPDTDADADDVLAVIRE